MKNKMTVYRLKKLLTNGYRVFDISKYPGLYDFEYVIIKNRMYYFQVDSIFPVRMNCSFSKAVKVLNETGYRIESSNAFDKIVND
jgi:hypothetical protein